MQAAEDLRWENALLVAGSDMRLCEWHDLKDQKEQLMCFNLPKRARVQNKTYVRLLVARRPSGQNVHLCTRLGLGEASQRPTVGAARDESPPAEQRAGAACRSERAAATEVSEAIEFCSLMVTHAMNACVALEHVHVVGFARIGTRGTTISSCVVLFCVRVVFCVHLMCSLEVWYMCSCEPIICDVHFPLRVVA